MMGAEDHGMLQQQLEEELRQLAGAITQREHAIAVYRTAAQQQQVHSSKPRYYDRVNHQQTNVAGDALEDRPGVESSATEISYTAALKSQAGALASALRRKEERIQALRLQAKFTRVEEVEIEAATYVREAARLSAKLNAGSDMTGTSKFAGPLAAQERTQLAAVEEYEKAHRRYQSRCNIAHQGWSTLEQKLELLHSDIHTVVQGSSELVRHYGTELVSRASASPSFAPAAPTPPFASAATAHADNKRERRAGCELVLLEDELAMVSRHVAEGHAQQQEQHKALNLKQQDATRQLAEGRQELAALRHHLAQLDGRAQTLTKELRVCERQLAIERKHAQAAEDRAGAIDTPHEVLHSTAAHAQQPQRHSATSTSKASVSGKEPKVPPKPSVRANAVPPARRGGDGPTSRPKTPAAAPRERSVRKGARQTYRYDRTSPPRGEMSKARYDHLTAKHRSKLDI